MAILTNNVQRCPDYQANSQNVQSRFFCDVPRGFITRNRNNNNVNIPITREECEVRGSGAYQLSVGVTFKRNLLFGIRSFFPLRCFFVCLFALFCFVFCCFVLLFFCCCFFWLFRYIFFLLLCLYVLQLVRYPNNDNGTNGTWTEVKPREGLSAPDCVESIGSRDNHLGNTRGGFPIYYNWTIPNRPHDHCAVRIRCEWV